MARTARSHTCRSPILEPNIDLRLAASGSLASTTPMVAPNPVTPPADAAGGGGAAA